MHQQEPAIYLVDGDLSYLRRKLIKGSAVPARIVLCLGDNKYLLRMFGHNLVMKSEIQFNQFDEVELVVNEVFPKFNMSIKTKNSPEKKRSGNKDAGMDIIV